MNFYFQYKEWAWAFLALAVFATLFVLLSSWKKSVKQKMGDAQLIWQLTKNFSSTRFTLKFVLVLLAFAAGVVALMNPRKPGKGSNIARNGINMIVALDVSKSMLATDVAPNRIELAKHFIGKLVDAMPDNRIGFVLFAGKAYLQMPLTLDHSAANIFITAAGTDAIKQQGTSIDEALKMCAAAFDSKDKGFKTIILITDGEEHDAAAVTNAEELATKGIMINCVGVGTVEGSTIPDTVTGINKTDAAGNVVVSKLNEDVLQLVAQKTNGLYVHLSKSDDAVAKLKKQLSHIETKSLNDFSLAGLQTFYLWFAAFMFIVLVIEKFIPERKKQNT